MVIKIHKINIVTKNGFYIKPRKLDITKEKILTYIKDNPMPEDPVYCLDDLIMDLAENSSVCDNYTLPIDIKEETMRFIEILIEKLSDEREQDIWKM